MSTHDTRRNGEIAHTKQRLLERYGLKLDEGRYWNLVNHIRKNHLSLPNHKGKAVFVNRKSRRLTRWFVWTGTFWIPVLYDKNTKMIATVLPRGTLGKSPPRLC